MLAFLWSAASFVVALGILVAVHEWGHFYVARRCGVKVERFSIGFGKPLWRTTDKHGTEFVVAAIPLGGYVRMLDGRVDDVPPEFDGQAFNQKPVLQRMAIIAAGPGVNFIFAVFALLLMYMIGLQTVKPVVGEVTPSSIAATAGLPEQSEIIAVAGRTTADWEAVNLELVSHIGDARIPLTVRYSGREQNVNLDVSQWKFDPDQQSALASLGITPFRPAATTKIAVVGDNTAAQRAGLQVNDQLTSLNGEAIANWAALVERVQQLPGATIELGIERDGRNQMITVTLDRKDTEFGQQGYLGVSPFAEQWPEGMIFTQQFGPVDAFIKGLERTWRLMTLSVEMIGKLITGDVSVKNLSGPISIAQGAGASAGYGLVYFLSFLALISVNLGIINLLPLPMLDGGHLMYFTIELFTGRAVPEAVQEWGFRIGGILLFTLMGIALINDINRIV